MIQCAKQGLKTPFKGIYRHSEGRTLQLGIVTGVYPWQGDGRGIALPSAYNKKIYKLNNILNLRLSEFKFITLQIKIMNYS
jgi:hypothetical protein